MAGWTWISVLDQLLLSEGVCRQLGIVTYHNEVGRCKDAKRIATITAASVSSVKTIRILPHQSVVIGIIMPPTDGPLLLEHDENLEESTCLQLLITLVYPSKDGFAYAVIPNPADSSSCVDAGTIVGKAVEVEIIKGGKSDILSEESVEESLIVKSVESEQVAEHKKKLLELINRPTLTE